MLPPTSPLASPSWRPNCFCWIIDCVSIRYTYARKRKKMLFHVRCPWQPVFLTYDLKCRSLNNFHSGLCLKCKCEFVCVCVCLSTYIVCIYSILLHNECTSMYSMCLSLTHSLLFRWTPPSISLKSSGCWWVSALSSTWGQINILQRTEWRAKGQRSPEFPEHRDGSCNTYTHTH